MIVCAGESLIDMIPAVSEDGRNCFTPHEGGSVYNTAIALGRLGVETGIVTGLSSDLFGKQLKDTLSASNVATQHVVTRDLPTTLAFVSIVDGQAEYAFYDENTAGRTLTIEQMPDLPEETTAVFVGGISLVQEPCGSAYESFAKRARGRAVVMCDPNIRPGFIDDEEAFRARLERLWACADIVKYSEDDYGWLVGDPDRTDEFRDHLLSRGVKLVIETRGVNGSVACTRELSVEVPAKSVEIVDTVGAGDTFNASVLASLARSGDLSSEGLDSLSQSSIESALEFGSRVSAISVSRPGANPPWSTEL